MSMLAEKKRKQKWSLNPRGKAWSQDGSKFGQKLLEKMGWSQGKGLGAKEDGRTEHIKVPYKNDSQGMGYKESDDQWTEHESNFTALLKALGGDEQKETEIKLSSLEKKSENSKARVHYRKFTRGKDLSRYSEKDLANIFGKKSLKEVKKAKKELELIEQEIKDEPESDKNFSNAGLMSEYFKKKLPDFGKTSDYVIGNNGVLKRGDSESESEQRPSFGFGFGFSHNGIEGMNTAQYEHQLGVEKETVSQNNGIKEKSKSFVSYISDNNIDEQISPKKKRDRKKRTSEEEIMNTDDTPTKKKRLEAKELSEEGSAKKTKDKSKKIKGECGLSNPAFEPLYTPIKITKHILDPIEESLDESLDRSLNDTVGQVAESFEVQVQIINENSPVKRRKDTTCQDHIYKSKKRKDKTNDDSEESSNINYSPNQAQELKRERKKCKVAEERIQEMDTSSLSNIMEINEIDTNDATKKGRKKKRLKTAIQGSIITDSSGNSIERTIIASKDFQPGIDNPFFNMSMEVDGSVIAETPENPYEIKVEEKKKKKGSNNKENLGVENPIFNGEDSINSQDLMNEEYEVTRKVKSKSKKKKKEENNNRGLDNPAMNLNDTIEEDEGCDLMLNVVTTTPIQTNLDRRESNETPSIHRAREVVTRRKSVRFSDVTRERIIPTKEEIGNETLDDSRDIVEVQGKLNDSSDITPHIDNKFIQKKKAKKRNNKGLDNGAFDQQANSIEENITSMSKSIDTFQAEIENDMNEAKMKSVEIEDIMVGEVGNPDGTNEKLPDGTVKLKFKYANFKKTAKFIESLTGARKSCKHLIKGDIVVGFKETNLHEINGYAIANANKYC